MPNNELVEEIKNSGLSIYDDVPMPLFLSTASLSEILQGKLIGLSLAGLPLRTRSKVVKIAICEALGYPIPKSFKKVKPRFPGQNFDVYTQQSLNVQIWNDDIDAARRYIFLRADNKSNITAVRVITGADLVRLDKTGTLTRKYQATMQHYDNSQLFSHEDTETVKHFISTISPSLSKEKPNALPNPKTLLSIEELYRRLLSLIGKIIPYIDAIQERNRGAELHAMVCKALGYLEYEDDGTYPDIRNQIAEIKLQTSPTIDLGCHSPLDHSTIISMNHIEFHSEDVRYIVFNAIPAGSELILKNLYIVTGKEFEKAFPIFGGRVQNCKLQIPLPLDFFNHPQTSHSPIR